MRSSLIGVAVAACLALTTPTFATPPPAADSPTVTQTAQPTADYAAGPKLHPYTISINLAFDQVLVPQTARASPAGTAASLLLGTTSGHVGRTDQKEGAAFAAESVGAGLGSPAGYFTG
jgi:hypothetical protein